MKYLDEYRDADAARQYAREIARVATRPWSHHGGLRRPDAHCILKFGLDQLLPERIDLIHGPGARSASRRWN